jgi:UDP-GlcNAc:undecaprenyl-phosphate GlcNAc-1-phosphate transferase
MIDHILKYVVVAAVGFATTYLLTPAVMALALRFGFVDAPGERRIHQGFIPRAGGLAVFLGFHSACAAMMLLPWREFSAHMDLSWWFSFLPASCLLLLVGLVDDRKGLSPFVKLALQLAASGLLYACGIRFEFLLGHRLPFPLDVLLTVFWCLGFINAFNLIDGLDGLAAGLATIASLGLAGATLLVRAPGDALVLLGLAGSCLAFLRYNFHPARVFLGDSGSMFLGFTLAAVSLSTGFMDAAATAVAIPLLAAGVPILDAALAVWRRTARRFIQSNSPHHSGGGGVFSADRDHMHHRLLRNLPSQRHVAFLLYGINAVLMGIGLLSLLFRSSALTIYLLAFGAGTYLIVRYLARVELWASGIAAAQGLRTPPRRAVVWMLFPPVDVLLLSLSLFLTQWLTRGSSLVETRGAWLHQAPYCIGSTFLLLVITRTYDRVWSRSRPTDHFRLIGALAGGAAVFAATIQGSRAELRLTILEAMFFWLLSGALLLSFRMLPRLLQDSLSMLVGRSTVPHADHVRTLVYGAGYQCALFLQSRTYEMDLGTMKHDIVGILDDNPNLHGRMLHGYRVLGGGHDAARIVADQSVQRIVVTTPLQDVARAQIELIAREGRVRVVRWETSVAEETFCGEEPQAKA